MPLVIRGNILQSRGRVDWLPDGNATQPSLTFATDPDTGLYRVADNDLALTAGGVDRLRVNASGATVTGNATMYGQEPTLTLAPSGTAQYTGSSLRLLNNADASTRRGVTMGTLVRDSDSNNSIFAIDILDNANAVYQTALLYDLSAEKFFITGGTRIMGDDLEVHGSTPSVTVQAFSNVQYTGGKLALNNHADLATRRGATVGTYVRDADGTDSYFAIDATSNTGTYLATLGRYDLSDHRWSFSTDNTERLAIEPAGNVTVTGNLNTSGTVTAATISGNLTTSHITSGTGNVDLSGNLNVSGLITGQGLAADLSISNVQITDSSWNLVDDTAVALTGGYVLVNGDGFAPGSMVQVGGTNATATSYVSSTQLRVQAPAKSTGTYDLTVIRGDTKTATLASAVSYSDAVTWITTSPLDTVYQYLPFTTTLQATSDSNVVYANTTTLPSGVTLNASTGVLDGNILTGNAETLYSFDVKAEDEELQDSIRTFLMQYYPFAAGKIVPSDYEASANFAYGLLSMTSDGTRVIVGAHNDDATGGANSGAAYIFSRSGTTWTQEQKIIPSDSEGTAYFGYSCAINADGTRAIVGAHADDATGGTDSGACYIFSRSGTTWTQEQKIIPSDSEGSALFGQSCGISSDGTRVIVGAYYDDATGGADSGACYIFSRSGTTWTQEQKLIASDGGVNDYFGWSCAISNDGTRVIVGAYYNDATVGGNNNGAAYVFSRSGTTWTQEQKLVPSDSEASAVFGYSCGISSDGSRVIVGAHNDDAAGGTDSGACYIFSRSGTTWTQEQKLVPGDSEAAARFGISCTMDATGSWVIVGASYDDATGGSESGAAYIFSRSGTSWTQEQKLIASDSEASAYFGHSCSISGNGSCAIVGAPYDDAGTTDTGAAYLFQRTFAGWFENVGISGGSITYSGGYTYHTFTTNGILTVGPGGKTIEYLIVGGGGGGGADVGGGGGAGQVITGTTMISSGSYNVIIGQGGVGGTGTSGANSQGYGKDGETTSFHTYTALGGGGGGNYYFRNGRNGASGGGGGGYGGTGGTASSGYSGASTASDQWAGGGGGGAGGAGNAPVGVNSIAGGTGGSSVTVWGVSYAGGGGGGGDAGGSAGGGGGAGGGGQSHVSDGSNASPNSGSGGGGGGGNNTVDTYAGGKGGSGIVIVRYLT